MFFDQHLAAFEIRFRRLHGGIALIDQRLRFRHRLLGALDIGLRCPEFGFIFRRRYAAHHLSRLDFAAFLHRDVNQPARIFRRDVDLRGFDPAIGLDDTRRHLFADQSIKQTAHLRLRVRRRNESA